MTWHTIYQDGDFLPILATVLSFILAFIGLIGGLSIGFVKTLKSTGNRKTRELDAEDTRAFQEIQRGFSRMEQRVESLETILVDREARESEPARF